MSRDLEVGLTVRMRDQVSTPAQQSERNVQRSVRQTAQTYVDASRVSVATSRMLYDVRMSQSARAEQAVQRNVHQTEAAYVQAGRNILTSSQRLAEWGIMDIGINIGAHTIDIPAPWVMMGMRKEANNTRCYLRGVVLRNQ